jgi:hypothetical protein
VTVPMSAKGLSRTMLVAIAVLPMIVMGVALVAIGLGVTAWMRVTICAVRIMMIAIIKSVVSMNDPTVLVDVGFDNHRRFGDHVFVRIAVWSLVETRTVLVLVMTVVVWQLISVIDRHSMPVVVNLC